MTPELALSLATLLVTSLGIYSVQSRIKRKSFELSIRVKFHESTFFDDGVLLDYSPEQPLSYYIDNNLIIKNTHSIHVEIENPSEIGLIKIAPYIFIKLKQRFNLPNSLLYYSQPREGMGGGGANSIYYDGLLYGESTSISIAPAYPDTFIASSFIQNRISDVEIPTKTAHDYYTVVANDSIELVLLIMSQPGMYFGFEIGIPISTNGKERIIWSEKEFTCATPLSGRRVKPAGMTQEFLEYDYGSLPEDFPDILLEDWQNQEFIDYTGFDKLRAKLLDNASSKLVRPMFPIAEIKDIKDGGLNDLLRRMTVL